MASEPDIDNATLQRAIGKDRVACARLVERYDRLVTGAILRVLEKSPMRNLNLNKDHPDVKDAFQATFASALTALQTGGFVLDEKRKFSTWLSVVAHNAAVDQLRKFHHRVRNDTIDLTDISDTNLDPSPSAEEMLSELV